MSELPPRFNAASRPAHLHPRVVPLRHVLAWYDDGMRLFKRAPATWAALAAITIGAELFLKAVPGLGSLLSETVTPLVACGLLYAAAVVDRHAAPRLSLAFKGFRAPPASIVAIVASALVPFVAEASATWWVAGVNPFDTGSAAIELNPATIAGIYTIGMLASLPVTFVPFHALFEQTTPRAAFVASWNAFGLNTLPLLAYAAASFVLLAFGLATFGLGLVIALPLWAASTYAAWKDIFGIKDAPAVD